MGEYVISTCMCAVYHLLLGYSCWRETEYYLVVDGGEDPSLIHQLIRYTSYFLFVFNMSLNLTDDPKRLRSVLSLMTAVILTPLSFYEISKFILQNGIFFHDNFQLRMLECYMSYCIADTIVARIYYPQYFGVLDGWFHHLSTFLFILYYYDKKSAIVPCIGFMTETSSVILCASRVFYGNTQLKWLKTNIFPTIFLLFRVVFLGLVICLFENLQSSGMFIWYCLFVGVNLSWFKKFIKK